MPSFIFFYSFFYLILSPFYNLSFIFFLANLPPSPFGEGWGGASSLTSPFGEGRGGAPLLPPRPMIEVYILSHKQVDRHIVDWFNLLFQHDSTEEGVNTEVALLVGMLCDEERYTPFS